MWLDCAYDFASEAVISRIVYLWPLLPLVLTAVLNMTRLVRFFFSPIGLCVVGVIEQRANCVGIIPFDDTVPLPAHLVFVVFLTFVRPSIPKLKPLAAELCKQGTADIEPTFTVDVGVDYTQRCFDAFIGN